MLIDPTSASLARTQAPRVVAWIHTMEDLSGWQDTSSSSFSSADHHDLSWIATSHPLPPSLHALLTEIGRLYIPFMQANAQASVQHAKRVVTTLDGVPWDSPTFPYQFKCWRGLHQQFAALPPPAQERVSAWLAPSACRVLTTGHVPAPRSAM